MLQFFIILSVLQGVTEFIPVSSSGHLAFIQNLSFFQSYKRGLGKEILFAYDVFIHLATFLSIVIFFRKILWQILSNDLKYIKGRRDEPVKKDFYLTLYIIIANIPVIIVGLLFKKNIENFFQEPHIISGFFIINGLILIATFFIEKGPRKMEDMGYGRAIVIGLAQTFAILPGISRSGSTIATAFFLKIKPEDGARFSFLLGLPVIFGAFLLELLHVIKMPSGPAFSMDMLLGMLVAFGTGLLSLKLLFWFVKKTVLFPFGIYTLLLGILGLLFF